MTIQPSFIRVASLEQLRDLRDRHLDDLPEPQDGFLEALVVDGDCYRIECDGETAGYFIVSGGVTLVEFYVSLAFEPLAHELVPRIVASLGIRKALVKTFDHMFMAAALDMHPAVRVKGALTRGFHPRPLPEVPGLRYTRRTARRDDLPAIRAVDQPVFTHPERLREAVDRGEVVLFERDDTLLGFGIMRTVIPGRPGVEVGIALDAPFRNQGYATHMMRAMVDACIERGGKPITGCARDNEPSVRMGLRAGLLSRHRILELGFADV